MMENIVEQSALVFGFFEIFHKATSNVINYWNSDWILLFLQNIEKNLGRITLLIIITFLILLIEIAPYKKKKRLTFIYKKRNFLVFGLLLLYPWTADFQHRFGTLTEENSPQFFAMLIPVLVSMFIVNIVPESDFFHLDGYDRSEAREILQKKKKAGIYKAPNYYVGTLLYGVLAFFVQLNIVLGEIGMMKLIRLQSKSIRFWTVDFPLYAFGIGLLIYFLFSRKKKTTPESSLNNKKKSSLKKISQQKDNTIGPRFTMD